MYDRLAGQRNVANHRHLSREQVLEAAPMLVPEGLKEGFMYYDAQTNDVRLTLSLIRTAARYGVVVANYAQATSFLIDNGKISGVQVHDTLNDLDLVIRARHVINATGIFAEQIEAMTGEIPQIQVEPSKGTHLVLSKEDLQLGNDAIVLPETEDKRILFIVPWMSRAIFGTTDTGTGDLDHPMASQEDITYLLKYLNRYSTHHFTEADIISTYAGYRPLVKPRQKNAATAKLSRTHAVIESPGGLVTIIGGKLTTYRRMAQDTMDVISKRDGTKPVHTTESLPLLGSAAWSVVARELKQRGDELGLTLDTIQHLGHSYGSEAHTILDSIAHDPALGMRLIHDLPYIRAEVIYSCRHEMALTPTDVLARRTSIMLEDRQQGKGIVDEVAGLMASELHWSPEQQQQLIQSYRNLVEGQLLVGKQ
jgi:glycerol-3-phosphate dehydrogenase